MLLGRSELFRPVVEDTCEPEFGVAEVEIWDGGQGEEAVGIAGGGWGGVWGVAAAEEDLLRGVAEDQKVVGEDCRRGVG